MKKKNLQISLSIAKDTLVRLKHNYIDVCNELFKEGAYASVVRCGLSEYVYTQGRL